MWRVCLVVAASCYRPTIEAGSPCGANGACPTPLMCAATGTCEVTEVDAPVADARGAIDAPKAADAPVDAVHNAPPPDAAPVIAWQATTSQNIPAASAAMSVTIAAPTGVVAGDMMIGVVAFGSTGEATAPAFTPPTGWTLVRQVDEGNDTALAVYWHAATAIEPTSYTFGFNETIEGVAWISLYTGVSTTSPVDVENGVLDSGSAVDYTAPSVTTTVPGDMLVVTFAAHDPGTAATWMAPTGANVRVDVNNTTTRSGFGFDVAMAAPGATLAFQAVASTTQDYALVHVLALRPGS